MDLSSLWDYDKPELSEERFRLALAAASGAEALVLQTQIARTYGLRRGFARARQILAGSSRRSRAPALRRRSIITWSWGALFAPPPILPRRRPPRR
jgi:hypothetical protein